MIRRAQPRDVPRIVELIRGLADYENALDECKVTTAQLHEALFGASPAAHAHVAEAGADVVGVAVWFRNFSTWDGVAGIHLEDLFVAPTHRGAGHGKALLAALARECAAHGYSRLSWSVLDWNTPSIGFYDAVGGQPQPGWIDYRLTGTALQALGGSDQATAPFE